MDRVFAEHRMPIGANRRADGCWEFLVWAPFREQVAVHLLGPNDRLLPMTRDKGGYHQIAIPGLPPHSRYVFRVTDAEEFPDPASRFQPEGVHGPSELVDLSSFPWNDQHWKAPRLSESIFYELYVGNFTPEGTLDAAASHLEKLVELGVSTVELMPVA